MTASENPDFVLNLTVTRPELVEWLAQIPAEQLQGEVERTLAAGHVVLTLMTASAGEDAMKRFFAPVVQRMDELDGSLKKLMGATNKSQQLGQMGESIVAQQLSRAFPNDHFNVVSKTGHMADIEATFDLGDDRKAEALVEVKLYTNDVPTAELDKFRRDLSGQQKRYGLMVSLTSRMMGLAGPVHVEDAPDYVAVYVPNAGVDGWGLLWGAAVLRSIMQFRERAAQGKLLSTGAVEQAWRRIQREMDGLSQVAERLQGMTAQVNKTREQVARSLDDLSVQTLGLELQMRAAMERIQERLTEELAALPQTGVPHQLLQAAPADAVLAALQNMEASDKRLPFLREVYKAAEAAGLQIALGEEPARWRLLRDGKEVAKTAGTRTRLDLEIQLEPGRAVTFVPGRDEVRGTAVVIRGEKIEGFGERVAGWLG